MYYTIIIIIAALILGLMTTKDQIQETDINPYRCFIELLCITVIITCVIMVEKNAQV